MRVCIATGRNYTESRPALEQIGIQTECVFVGGALVIDTGSGKTLHRTAMHPQVAADACRILESLGHAALALQDTCETGLDYLISRDLPVRPASQRWMAAMRMGIEYVPDLADFHHHHTLRVGICCESEEMEQIMPVLQKHFGNRAMMHRLRVPGASCEVLEVFDPAVSKWEGISFVIRRHHIDPAQVIAVGDDMNDLHMIRHAGLGVAMGNARPELKAAADRVIGKNTDDGLAQFLEELVAGCPAG
jgi:Cof subfamily protein (haloacid dehalogenase superfamily)